MLGAMTTALLLLATDAEPVGVKFILPAWLLVTFTLAGGLATVITTLKLVAHAIRPIHEEIRRWMDTTDKVTAQAPKWDEGLNQLASAVTELAEVTRTLGNVQTDISAIRTMSEEQGRAATEVIAQTDQVRSQLASHIEDSGQMWSRVNNRLGRIEDQGKLDTAQADRIEHQDDPSRPLMGPRETGPPRQ